MLNRRCIPDSLLLLVFVDWEEQQKPWEYRMESSGCSSVCNQNGEGCLQFAWEKQNKRQVVKPWKPPASDFVKVNTDGTFDETTCKGGAEVVIRDANKQFVKAQSRWYDHLGDAMISEVLAIRDGLALAKEEGLERIIVESDNLAMVNLMNNAGAS
jgi:hypothetical protein